jgi:hypothetical protein
VNAAHAIFACATSGGCGCASEGWNASKSTLSSFSRYVEAAIAGKKTVSGFTGVEEGALPFLATPRSVLGHASCRVQVRFRDGRHLVRRVFDRLCVFSAEHVLRHGTVFGADV